LNNKQQLDRLYRAGSATLGQTALYFAGLLENNELPPEYTLSALHLVDWNIVSHQEGEWQAMIDSIKQLTDDSASVEIVDWLRKPMGGK
jgi:hypothetical protein